MAKSEFLVARPDGTTASTLGRLKRTSAMGRAAWALARREDGSVTIFSLFVFILILCIGGMAVDLMRFETQRAALQNTLDASTLAAANLRSEADAEELVRDFMEKRGYERDEVSIDVEETFTGANAATNDPGTLVARLVTADYDLNMDTFFMPLLGIDTLGTLGAGGAQEGMTTVEISLVVDISGSMGGQKLTDLKSSAGIFFDKVIDPTRTDMPVTISIVPYNQTVVVPDELMSRLNTQATVVVPPSEVAPYDWAQPLLTYDRTAPNSTCVRFYDDEMIVDDLQEELDPALNPNYLMLRAITTSQVIDRMGYYDQDHKSAGDGGNYDRPADDYNRRCDPTRTDIMLYETDANILKGHINGMEAGGWTATDTGLKWGVALLDPAFRPLVSSLVTAGDLPAALDGRPFDYDPANFMKVVVLMTDGANTNQYDLDGPFKNGPSRIWFSEQASMEEGPEGEDWSDIMVVDTNENGDRDRDKAWYDGYFVEMPANDADERWLRPHSIGNQNDAVLYPEADLPADAVQLSYTELYDRFSERAVSYMFRDNSYGDWDAYNDHRYAEQLVQNGTSANKRMNGSGTTEHGMCDAAKVNNEILVFTIAFQAGSTAESVMRECATADGYYFNAQNGDQLTKAYETIAATISALRLSQ